MSKRILFVDDDKSLLDGLRRSLRHRRREWEMTFVDSGQAALASLEQVPYDALVTDMRMPGMNGEQLLEIVAQRYPGMIRIILSGHAESESGLRAAMNAHQYLPKPCDTQRLEQALDGPFAFQEQIGNDHIGDFIAGLRTLPSLPAIYMELVRKLNEEDVTVREVGRIIARDPAMTAKLLQMVNSAFFGLGRQVSDPGEAAVVLGMDTLKNLVLSIGIFRQFESAESGLPFDQIWEHSNKVGTLARQIAEQQQQAQSIQDGCALSGLLHDLGAVILAVNHPEAYRRVYRMSLEEHLPLHVVEKRELGASHNEVGAYLLSLWGFHPDVVEAVAFHTDPEAAPHQGQSILTAVYIANLLLHLQQMGIDDDLFLRENSYIKSLDLAERVAHWKELAAQLLEGDGPG